MLGYFSVSSNHQDTFSACWVILVSPQTTKILLVHAGLFGVSTNHPTLTWMTGPLIRIHYILACVHAVGTVDRMLWCGQIHEEDALLAVAAWPMLVHLVIHNNPLTTSHNGDPPLLKRFLSDRLGIKLQR